MTSNAGAEWRAKMEHYIFRNYSRITEARAAMYLAFVEPERYRLRWERDRTYPNQMVVRLDEWVVENCFPLMCGARRSRWWPVWSSSHIVPFGVIR